MKFLLTNAKTENNIGKNLLRDRLNRPLHDLRISVIDRCNFRCTYCMPEDEGQHYQFLEKKDWLTLPEIFRLAQIFVNLGVSKVRLTGGEPLLRPDLPRLIEQLSRITSIDDLALTTNGSLLHKYAVALKAAGLKRLTVSLDTLDEKVFARMNGGRSTAAQILKGIKEAERAGFSSIKINTVVQKGINDHTLLDLIRYFKGTGHVVRFIEYMDVGNCNHWESKFVVPSKEILNRIHKHFPLKPVEPNYTGEVAERYQYLDGTGEIGFIASVTQPFCGNCSRARISTDGKLYTCLFAGTGTDLRTPLREGASDEELLERIKSVWTQRQDRYSENRALVSSIEGKSVKKIEMFQIGG